MFKFQAFAGLLTCCLLACCSAFGSSATAPGTSPTLEIGPLNVEKGIDVPAEYLTNLQVKLAENLTKSKAFASIQQQTGDSSASSDLGLTWTITSFEAGSRKKRLASTSYGRLFGMGATRMKIHVQLRDHGNSVMLDKQIEGSEKGTSWNPVNVTAGFNSSDKIIETEAKKVADEIEKAVREHSRAKP